jgi:serine phosphatase RsbU (regulator of sigma subunit)
MLVLYTDGLTEARRDGVLFGVEGVTATFERLSGESPSRLANGLVEAALEHAAKPLSDDVAIVIVRVQEPGRRE